LARHGRNAYGYSSPPKAWGGWSPGVAPGTQRGARSMHSSSFHYLPLAPWFFLGLVLLFGLVIFFLQLGILGYAYERMGISRRAAYGLLFLSLLGASVNLPIAELPGGEEVVMREATNGWLRWQYPVVKRWPKTTLAVNVGGAVIPTLLSIYLIVKNQI